VLKECGRPLGLTTRLSWPIKVGWRVARRVCGGAMSDDKSTVLTGPHWQAVADDTGNVHHHSQCLLDLRKAVQALRADVDKLKGAR